jgi:hypothetical protein
MILHVMLVSVSIVWSGRFRTAACEVIYRQKTSGRNINLRPELARAIDRLGVGGILVVAEWDRATRSIMAKPFTWT